MTVDEFKLLGTLKQALGISKLFEQSECQESFSEYPSLKIQNLAQKILCLLIQCQQSQFVS